MIPLSPRRSSGMYHGVLEWNGRRSISNRLIMMIAIIIHGLINVLLEANCRIALLQEFPRLLGNGDSSACSTAELVK